MLEGLDDIEWDQLTHAYGQAGGIPTRIRALQSSDPADWVRAMSDLYDALSSDVFDLSSHCSSDSILDRVAGQSG
jgi:hypothetical protein